MSVDAGEGVLADVIGSPGATLTAALVTGPESGTLSLAADGSFTFTPAQGFVGAVAFDYEPIEDGTPLAVRTVVIPVTNARPYAYGAEFSIKHDTALSGALDGQDNDGDALTFAVTAPPAGQLALDAGTGAFTYTPPPGFVGDDTFQYVVSDGIDTSDPETVLIRVTTTSRSGPPTLTRSYTTAC
ncbi:MAG: cadherin-like domain-containing protein [Gemmataceae bacterium]|nr:cadherin-like domain-containing protein [Gemmataceae bacterium]